MDITPNENTNFIVALVAKITAVFLSFVGGVVTATWVVAIKIKGFEDRLGSIEKVQENCPGKTLIKIDEKLDRIHERIDEIVLKK